MKGGDFMEIEQKDPKREASIEDAVSRMEWEGAPISGEGFKPSISPDQEIVTDDRRDPTHPLVRGRIKTP